MISKGERTELRSIVRQQFKVLRSEVEQRRLELYAEVEDQIASRFSETDAAWRGVQHEVTEATLEANRRVNDALYTAGYQAKGNTERQWFTEPALHKPEGEKYELRRQAKARIDAQVKAAHLVLERQEADLLKTLALAEIEAALGESA